MVRIGSAAFRSVCLVTTHSSPTPLARAVRTKSARRTSSTAERVIRAMDAIVKAPERERREHEVPPVPSAGGREEVEPERQHQDEQDADEEGRRRLPDQRQAHRRVVEEASSAAPPTGRRSGTRRPAPPRTRRAPARTSPAGRIAPPPSRAAGSGSSARSRRARTFARKTPYWTGRDRSRPRSRRTRSISEIGASGGRSSGTGSPDSRITTNTTVETSQRATRVRNSR